MNFLVVCKISVNSLINFYFKYVYCDLEEDSGIFIKKQILDFEEYFYVNYIGEYSEELVQVDQGEFCNDMYGVIVVSVSQYWIVGYYVSS